MSYKAAVTQSDRQEAQFLLTYPDYLSHHLNEPWHTYSPNSEDRFAKESLSLQATLHPTAWMGRCSSAIINRPLRSVVLPGAHDSGTYSLSSSSQYGADLKSVKALRALSAVGLGKVTKGIVASWAVCQTADTRTQLLNGVRYFDLRVAALNNEFFIWHGLCGEKIESVITEMANYAKAFPTEIIVVDLVPHHFNDFTAEHHARFAELLYGTFGSILCRNDTLSAWSTVGQFWEAQTNVIVLYQPTYPNPRHGAFWWRPDMLHSHWPNHVKNPSQWVEWAGTHLSQREYHHPLWVLQGVITPDAGIIAKFNGVNSVQDLSRLLNPKAVDFLLQNVNGDHNIVMLDFYDNCSLTNAVQWANIGGQHLFADRDLLSFRGHQSHFQAISVDQTPGDHRAIAVSMKSTGEWISAVMCPSDPLPWTITSPLRGLFTQEPMYHSTMRLFHMDNVPYAAMSTPIGARILRFDWTSKAWTLFSEVHGFGEADGYGTPSPVMRSTFSVLSPKDDASQTAWLCGLTTNGITVTTLSSSSFHPILYNWEPHASMLSTYFALYAPPSLRQYYACLTQHQLGYSRETASASSLDSIPSIPVHPFRLNSNSDVHTAFTQVCPFIIKKQLHLFVQAPVSVLFKKIPDMYQSEAVSFICRFNTASNSFMLLAIDGLPPPVHRGTHSAAIPEDLLIGSPWHLETIGDIAYLLCRSSNGIRTWKFDGVIMSELPPYKAFLDTFHWNESHFAGSLRTFVLNERLFFMGRSSAGIVLISLQNDAWVPAPGMAEFSDFSGWGQEEHAKSLQVTVAGPIVYVTGRCPFGLVSVSFDGAEWKHFERPIFTNSPVTQ